MGRTHRRRKTNTVQSSILMLAGLLGLARQIPLTNRIGDDGNAYFAAAYEICMVFLMLTSYWLPEAVAGMVEARISKAQFKNAGRVLKAGLFFSGFFSLTGATAMIFGAEVLAEGVLAEPLGMYALRAFAPVLFIMTVTGVLRGWFEGLGTGMPSAVSSLLEQIILWLTVLIGSGMLTGYGADVGRLLKNEHFKAAYGSMGAAAGISAGLLSGLLFLLFVFGIYRKVLRRQIQKDQTRTAERYGQLIAILLRTAAPLLLPMLLYFLGHLAEQAMFNRYMTDNGMGDLRAAQWGVYFGKYRVLTRLPFVFAVSTGLSFLSGIRNAVSKSDYMQAKERTQTALHLVVFLAAPWVASLGVLAKPVVGLLYDGDSTLGASLLYVGSFMVLLLALAVLTGRILQEIGKSRNVIWNALAAFAVQITAFVIFLQYLDMKVYAAVYAEMIGALVLSVLNMWTLCRLLHYRQEWIRTFVMPFGAAAASGVAQHLLLIGFSNLIGNLAVIPVLLIGSVLYLAVVLAFKGISERELARVPFGKTLVKAAKAVRLL